MPSHIAYFRLKSRKYLDNTGLLTLTNNINLSGAYSISSTNWNISTVGRATLQAITFNGTAGISCTNATGITFDFKQKLFIALKKTVNINRFCDSAFKASEIKPPIFDNIDLPGCIEHFSNHSRDRRAMTCTENH